MSPIQQQMTAVARIQFETQLVWYRELSQTAIESMERLLHLNIAAARASMQDSSATAKQMLQASGPTEVMSIVRAQAGPNMGKAIAYSNHVVNIASDAHTELTRCAETQIAEAGQRAGDMIEAAARSAPGSEPFLALMKSAIGSTSSGYQRLNRSSREAVETLEANVNAAVNQIVHPASTPESPDQPTTPTVGG